MQKNYLHIVDKNKTLQKIISVTASILNLLYVCLNSQLPFHVKGCNPRHRRQWRSSR